MGLATIPITTSTSLQMLAFTAVAIAVAQGSARKFRAIVSLLALQSLVIAVTTLVVGLQAGQASIIWAVVVAGICKVVLMPAILIYMYNYVGGAGDNRSLLAPDKALVVTIGVVTLSYYIAPTLLPANKPWGEVIFPAALSVMMIGLYLMAARRSALYQVAGLLVMENGLSLATLATTHGMPVLVELGVLLGGMGGIFVMSLLVRGMHQQLESTDTTHLRRLRG